MIQGIGAVGIPLASVPAVANVWRACAIGDSQTFATGSTHTGGFEHWLASFASANKIFWLGSQRATGTVDGFYPCEGYPGYSCRNASAPGQLYPLLDGIVSARTPNLILFCGGMNDIGYGATPAETAQNHLDCLNKLFADAPSARVIVSTLWINLNPGSSGYTVETLDAAIRDTNTRIAANVAVLQATGKNIRICDLYAACAARSDYATTCLYVDNVHFNDAGQQLWATALQPVITAALV